MKFAQLLHLTPMLRPKCQWKWAFTRHHSGLWQKKKTLKKSTPPKKKHIFLAKKHPFHKQKALLERKKALSKHYFINEKQQESTCS